MNLNKDQGISDNSGFVAGATIPLDGGTTNAGSGRFTAGIIDPDYMGEIPYLHFR